MFLVTQPNFQGRVFCSSPLMTFLLQTYLSSCNGTMTVCLAPPTSQLRNFAPFHRPLSRSLLHTFLVIDSTRILLMIECLDTTIGVFRHLPPPYKQLSVSKFHVPTATHICTLQGTLHGPHMPSMLTNYNYSTLDVYSLVPSLL